MSLITIACGGYKDVERWLTEFREKLTELESQTVKQSTSS